MNRTIKLLGNNGLIRPSKICSICKVGSIICKYCCRFIICDPWKRRFYLFQIRCIAFQYLQLRYTIFQAPLHNVFHELLCNWITRSFKDAHAGNHD